MARSLQLIGLPESADEILYKKFIAEDGEVQLVPKYTKRLRGYTEPLFYDDRAPLYEYVNDTPPKVYNNDGFTEGELFLIEVVYHETLQGAPWYSGPMAHMQLVETATGEIVASWPVDEKYGSIISDY